MSKSLSREERRQRRRERRESPVETPTFIDYGEAEAEPETITPEWALARLEDTISFSVATLLHQGVIGESEMDDYEQWLRIAVVEALPKYDPTRAGRNGRTSSAVHFLRVVLERKIANMVEEISNARARLEEMIPIEVFAPKENDGYSPEMKDLFEFGDKGEFVERMDFRMDMQTIAALLPERERKAFVLILNGYSHLAVRSAIGLGKSAYFEYVIPAIAKVLVRCGYGPKRPSVRFPKIVADYLPVSAV